MNVRDLFFFYALVGVACAIAVWRREHGQGSAAAVWSALATVPLWPLWAPFVLATPRPRERPVASQSDASPAPRRSASASAGLRASAPVARIEYALDESVKAVAGTPMSQVFSRQVAQRISSEVALVARRIEELGSLSASQGLDREASEKRLRDLESRGAPERTVATVRLQHESLTRLERLRADDTQALEELADLMEALRAQLLVARYAGASADGTGAIVSEVWARLEGLGGAFESSMPNAGAA